MDNTDAIRTRAYFLWLDEGRPEGRAEAHWDIASELVAIEENRDLALKPNPLSPGEDALDSSEPVESAEVMENLGDLPTLTDRDEELTVPPKRRRSPPETPS